MHGWDDLWLMRNINFFLTCINHCSFPESPVHTHMLTFIPGSCYHTTTVGFVGHWIALLEPLGLKGLARAHLSRGNQGGASALSLHPLRFIPSHFSFVNLWFLIHLLFIRILVMWHTRLSNHTQKAKQNRTSFSGKSLLYCSTRHANKMYDRLCKLWT